MRRIILTAIFLTGVLAVFASPPARASVSWSVSITSFHETLAPYGRWVVTRGYGEVWIPASIVVGWEPYSDGEWIWTDYGWTWVSYDPWGDAPCHYGTWVWVDPYGWVWLPGTIWAPAWVTWAWTDDYIGWAPVPATFVLASSGYSGPAVVAAPARYVFVPANQFVGVNVQTVRVPVSQNSVILPRARKATRFSVSGGIVRPTADPPLAFVQRVSGKRIERASINKLKTRPSPISAAHVSGKTIRVVAPASERSAAAATKSNRKETVVQPGKQTRATSSTGKGHPKPSHEARTSQARAAPSARAATASPANGSKSRSHEKSVKTEPARPAGKPEKSIVQESRARPASRPKEERHAQSGEHAAKVPPPRESSREPAPAQVPRPQVQENPHAAPPPPAQAPKPPPPPPKEKGKEKGPD